MATIEKNLGTVTAYKYAKNAGYTGTESEFAEGMKKSAEYAENAQASATAAAGSASSAAASKTDAQAANTAAQSAKTEAQSAQTAAEAWATGGSGGTPSATNNAQYWAEKAEDWAAEVDPDQLAHIDGYYEDLTAGNADQLVTNIGVEDKVPYNFRKAGGAEIGNRVDETVVGGSIGWNQLLNFDTVTLTQGKASIDQETHRIVVTYAEGDSSSSPVVSFSSLQLIVGHKYFMLAKLVSTSEIFRLRFYLPDRSEVKNINESTPLDQVFVDGCVFEFSTGNNGNFSIEKASTNTMAQTATVACKLVDLTAMFGSEIADYVYSLEQTTEGAGAAWVRKLFPKDYYEFSAGTMAHVQTSAHETIGFNQWDEEWEVGGINEQGVPVTSSNFVRTKNFIPVFPGTDYKWTSLSGNLGRLFFYDASKTFISYRVASSTGLFTTPANAHFLKFRMASGYGNVYNHDICVNISYDGSRNGEYEPYVKHSYPLDDTLTLRGIPKLDANDRLYFDGDVYKPDGTVTRRFGAVDLGSLTWEYGETATAGINRFRSSVINDLKQSLSTSDVPNIFCPLYKTGSSNTYRLADMGISVSSANQTLFVRNDSYTDPDVFKTAMSGVYLVYELATPTNETADAYASPQIVDNFGTERYVDYAYEAGDRDFEVPVGHDSLYQANLKAKLEMSPNSPSGDGDYIVRQTGGMNAYVPLEEVRELPTAPTTDGTYTLKATVSGGVATLSWVAE